MIRVLNYLFVDLFYFRLIFFYGLYQLKYKWYYMHLQILSKRGLKEIYIAVQNLIS